MALNTFNFNYLTPLHFKGLIVKICFTCNQSDASDNDAHSVTEFSKTS